MSLLCSLLFVAGLVACGGDDEAGAGGSGGPSGSSGALTIDDVQQNYCNAQCNFFSNCGLTFPNCVSTCLTDTAESFVALSGSCESAVNGYATCLGNLSCMDFQTGCQSQIQAAADACDGAS